MDKPSISAIESYENYYRQANNSKAHSLFCQNVFDIDLTQDGFSDKQQLDFLLDKTSINSTDTCLDIGCGNGKIGDFLYTRTNATFHGVDGSSHAIDFAQNMFGNVKNLSFFRSDINKIDILSDTHSVIIPINSIYFSDNYEETIRHLINKLKLNGRIAIYYSEFIFNTNEQLS